MLNGEVPDILSGSEVSLNDYTETYEKEGPGKGVVISDDSPWEPYKYYLPLCVEKSTQ